MSAKAKTLAEKIKAAKQTQLKKPGGLPFNVTFKRPTAFIMDNWRRPIYGYLSGQVLLNPVKAGTENEPYIENDKAVEYIVFNPELVLIDSVVGWTAKEIDLIPGGIADIDAAFDIEAFIEFVGDYPEAYKAICNAVVESYIEYHKKTDETLGN